MTDTAPDITTGDDGFAERRWTYIGRRFGAKRKVLHHFVDHRGEVVGYDRGPDHAVIGGVYTVEALIDSTSARPKSARYVERSKDPAVDEWRLRDRTTMTEVEQDREAKRQAADNGDFGSMTLRELRTLLRRRPFNQQAGMLAAVIAYLEGQARP